MTLRSKQNPFPFAKPSTDEYDAQAWATPWVVFCEIQRRYALGGLFTWDIAASETNTKCDGFWSEEHDALSMPNWRAAGRSPFCNPPWGNIFPFMRMAHREVHRGHNDRHVFCVPGRTGTDWYHFAKANGLIIPMRGRVNYVPPPNRKKKDNGAGEASVVVIFERALCPGDL